MVDDKQDKKKIRETLYNKALEQLKKYRQSDEFSKMKNLKTYILIFVGDKCEVCEEVTTSSKSLMLSC